MGRWVRWRVAARRRARSMRGAAAVELALILPVLMIVVVGIINYGDVLSVRQSVSQAAAEGARAAAVDPGDTTAKTSAAKSAVASALDAQGQKCDAWGTGEGNCNVSIGACSGDATKQCATVKVTISYDALIPGFDLVVPDRLSYTAVARVS